MKKITLGFSPCPNDTFTFDALIHRRIDTQDLEFDVVIADVEELNRMAMESRLDVTKMSYYAYSFAADRYRILTAGSALGFGCGPLLISKVPRTVDQLRHATLAIPGHHTTANFLLRYVMGPDVQVEPMLFSEIEDAVLAGRFDAGVIIHENRFTYADKGLHLVMDLGASWEKGTGLPIPLGAIAVHRRVAPQTAKLLNRLIRQSVEFALAHPDASAAYVKQHARELDDSVIRRHIDLYVNRFSVALGPEGKRAVRHMLSAADIGTVNDDLFCDDTEEGGVS